MGHQQQRRKESHPIDSRNDSTRQPALLDGRRPKILKAHETCSLLLSTTKSISLQRQSHPKSLRKGKESHLGKAL